MTSREKYELLGKIESRLIYYLNFHKEEKAVTENFLKKGDVNDHTKYFNAYEDGPISALKDAIDVIRKEYDL